MTMNKYLMTAVMGLTVQAAMAQGQRISGTITDTFGGVIGANVVELDANNRIVTAVVTDMNGNFSMAIKNPKNKLRVSYVGYSTVTMPIGNRVKFNVPMSSKTQVKEVTVTSRRRSNSGGLSIPKREVSVASQTMDMSSVEGLSFTSADEALQGEIAGLDIVSNSGNLGSGTTMRLRGVTTINGDANPLIVVDDKIFDNPDEDFDFQNANEEQYASLLSVNVEDISKIEVLKDAAATALWGSRGANGVIQITTKRGVRGPVRVNFSYKLKGAWQPKGYNLLNGDEYTMLMKEEFYNPKQSATATTNIAEINYDQSWNEYENWNNNTDWVDAVTQFGPQHNYNLNLSGGGEKATFRISASYDNQTGSIIKQNLQRFTTRLVLDYTVSDRIKFSTNFALTYTDNKQNYSSLLSIAQQLAPNMSIYRQDGQGNDTNDYFIMNPLATGKTPYDGAYTSQELKDVRSLGNPVAIANQAWKREQTYRITPDFTLKYELLGTGEQQHRLSFEGRVDFDIYANSKPTWYPASLSSDVITGGSYNVATNDESNRTQVGARARLVYTPYFKNEDWTATMLAQYEMHTSKSNSQSITTSNLPTGISSTLVDAYLKSMSSSASRSNDQNMMYHAHAAYKGRYILDFSLRADGNSKFGPKNKWGYFPGASIRYNISDEPFMKWSEKVVSMLGLRASWGITGRAPSKDNLFYSTYSTASGYYGQTGALQQISKLDGIRLDDLRWEKTEAVNLGFNLELFNSKFEIDFDYYYKNTSDLLMQNVGIASSAGYSTLAYANVGRMTNQGWEVNFNARKFIKKGKFSVDASFNIAQNYNEIAEMDQSVLNSINSEWQASDRGTYLNRIQVGNPMGSIYGYRYKGVYQYTYEYLQNLRKEAGWTDAEYESEINSRLAAGQTFPVAVDANGKVVMTGQAGSRQPQRMVYNYQEGSSTYQFQGGDAIYEDVNHDGQINALDVVYLGNSMPKLNGGFNLTFRYGAFSVKTRFMYRFGNKVVNIARMNLEKMYGTANQSATVNYRWRKDGDITPMPRAMYNAAYNWQGSDRYVEDGSFVRFQNLQVSYAFPKKMIKRIGLNNLQLYFSMDNLYCWTKYSGVDPEVTIGSWGVAQDKSQTPRAKSFTFNINVGF